MRESADFDLGDELALAVAGPEFNRPVGLGGGAVGEIGVIFAFLLQRGQRVAAFVEDRLPPGDELAAEIFPLSLAHERFVVRRLVAFNRDVVHRRFP